MAKKKPKTKRRATIAGRKANAVPLLAMGFSAKQVSEQIGCSQASVYDWLRDKEFRAEVIRERAKFLDQAAGLFAASLLKAVHKVRNLIDSGNESIALGAAKTLLEYSIKYYHMVDLERRVAELESQGIEPPEIDPQPQPICDEEPINTDPGETSEPPPQD